MGIYSTPVMLSDASSDCEDEVDKLIKGSKSAFSAENPGWNGKLPQCTDRIRITNRLATESLKRIVILSPKIAQKQSPRTSQSRLNGINQETGKISPARPFRNLESYGHNVKLSDSVLASWSTIMTASTQTQDQENNIQRTHLNSLNVGFGTNRDSTGTEYDFHLTKTYQNGARSTKLHIGVSFPESLVKLWAKKND